jgi:hypothetical protein
MKGDIARSSTHVVRVLDSGQYIHRGVDGRMVRRSGSMVQPLVPMNLGPFQIWNILWATFGAGPLRVIGFGGLATAQLTIASFPRPVLKNARRAPL